MSEREAEAILRAGALAGEAAGWKVRALNAEAEVGRLRGQLHSLREAVRVYLTGALLDKEGRFSDERREALHRAARASMEEAD